MRNFHKAQIARKKASQAFALHIYTTHVLPFVKDKSAWQWSFQQLANHLNQKGVTAARGGEWSVMQVRRVYMVATDLLKSQTA